MIYRPLFAVLVATVACSIAGCPSQDAATGAGSSMPTGPVLLTVNGTPVTEDLFKFYVENRTKNPIENLTEENRQRLMDEIVQLYVVADAAERDGLANDPEVAHQIELQRVNLLAGTYVKKFAENNAISDEELKPGYAQLTAQGGPVEYKARHILLETEDEAKAVIDELKAGGDFKELAKTKSTGPSGKDGGDLGWFTAERMVPEFSAAVADMEKGTFSMAPVQTQFGWHVILAEDTRQAPPKSLEEYRQEVEPSMQQQKIQEMLNSLQSSATVVKPST